MRAEYRAEKIMSRAHVSDPIAHGFVNGILESAAAGIHADNLRAQHAHARHVERLPRHVFRAHVNDAFQAEMRGHGSGSDAVLPRTRFRDDAWLAHFHGEQTLANRVVDLVRASVQQILALEIDARATKFFREPRSKLQRRRAAGEILQEILEVSLKRWIRLRRFIGALQLEQRHHQCFGNVAAAIRAKAARRCRR